MAHEIILKDGTTITAELNGNNYIAQQDVQESQFAELDGMTIDGIEQKDAVLSNLWKEKDGTHIIFGVKTEADRLKEDITNIQIALTELYEGGAV